MRTKPSDLFAEELRLAVEAVKAAGDEVMRLRREGLRYGRKAGMELVSEADLHAAEILHDRLTSAFPADGWLSEEHVDTAERLGRDRTWIVDPIDGTREFLMGVPEFAISVGLAVEGEPVLGVVFNPASGELDASVCVESEEIAGQLTPPRLEVLVGRAELGMGEVPPLPHGTEIAGIGSVAYRLAVLARGRGHAVVTAYGRAEWDVAAGVALCRAAGLRATGVLGAPLRFNQEAPYVPGLLVAGAAVHALLSTHFDRYRR